MIPQRIADTAFLPHFALLTDLAADKGANGLANFFLIDHSLERSGGHHSDYVNCIARAANGMGFLTTIGTNVKLRDSQQLNGLGAVKRVFRQSTYQRDSYLAGLRHLTRAKNDFLNRETLPSGFVGKSRHFLARMKHRNRREKFVRNFAQDCERFFQNTLLTDADHAFFTTVSELELMGLASYLANTPRTLQVHWHLQFHYNLFDGRPPEYKAQSRVSNAIQSCFDAALSRIPYHAIHFYTTSKALADQYDRLGVGEFEPLPYPVSTEFRINDTGEAKVERKPGPLRVTCPGEVRREKGVGTYLQPLVNNIWDNHLSQGKVKLVVQRPVRKWPAKQKILLALPESINDPASASMDDKVEYHDHPLKASKYVELLKNSDCGLLFYDSRTYFSRRAGVLGELLSCGKPVIVPAGSWLSEQVQESIYEHVDLINESPNLVRKIGLDQISWDRGNVPLPGGILSFDDAKHPFRIEFELDEEETGLVVGFSWHWPQQSGVYCNIALVQKDRSGEIIGSSNQVVSHRDESHENPKSFFNLKPACSSVEIVLRNAFHQSTASVKDLTIKTVANANQVCPIGAVGIVATDVQQLPKCIDEMVEHYEHYRSTAERFAKSWYLKHQPSRTVAHLMSCQHADAGSRAA